MSACPKSTFKRVQNKVVKIKLQEDKCCWVCGSSHALSPHHVFGNTGNRSMSEKYGLVVWMCFNHHTGGAGIHFDTELRKSLQAYAKDEFIKVYSAELFYQKFRGRFWHE